MAGFEGTPYVLDGVLQAWLEQDPVTPGRLPEVLHGEPPRRVEITTSSHGAVTVTENVGNTGLVGLTVRRGGTEVTVALPPRARERVAEALLGSLPAPFIPVSGGGRR